MGDKILFSKISCLISIFIALMVLPDRAHTADCQIIIKTTPDDANIYINNHYIGKSPLIIKGIQKNRTYDLKVEKWGYKNIEKQLHITHDSQKILLNLEKKAIRRERPNAIFFNILGESLFLGLEYVRFLNIPFGSVGISGGLGTWILGSAVHSTGRLIFGNYNRFSPFVGAGFSVYFYSVGSRINFEETSFGLVALYFPMGVLCSINKRLVISFECSYWVVAGGYVKKIDDQPDIGLTDKAKSTLWGGMKFGFLF